MSKICTDLKQSRKLVELGLDPKTADMHWWPNGNGFQLFPIPFKNDGSVPECVAKEIIPAWSLSALLELMPKTLKVDILPAYDLTIDYHDGFSYVRAESALEPEGICNAESFIDNAYEMVCWLVKDGYIITK